MAIDKERASKIVKYSKAIDKWDYYKILRLERSAAVRDVKLAFFKQSKMFHPDRYFMDTPPQVTEAVNKIFKRISEAYSVLREPETRKKYDAAIDGPNREKYLRYDRAAMEAEKKRKDEELAKTPMGKKYVKLALEAIGQRNYASAEMNLKLAQSMESDNRAIKAKIIEVRKLAGQQVTEEEEAFLKEHG